MDHSRFPNTYTVLFGYLQGAQLVHNAAQKTSSAEAAKVVAGTFRLIKGLLHLTKV
jgi:hypothetical protein